MKPIYVLGTGLSHDGSACLLKDGRICVAIEKERITRIKHDGGNDNVAIQYCLDAEGINISDISLVVQNANFGMFERGNSWFRGKRLISDTVPVVSISHHLAHAYSAFGPSSFEEAAVLVIDGCGNCLEDCIDLGGVATPVKPSDPLASLYFEKDSYYAFSSGQHKTLYKDFSLWGIAIKGYPLYPNTTRDSIGGLYAAASNYVFGGMDDSGKLMGLAPYGRSSIYDFDIFDCRDGRAFVLYDWMKQFNTPARNPEDFKVHFQHFADLAHWVQREVERAIIYVISSRYDTYPCPNLCYSGGVALNAVANRRILKECPFENLFIEPAAGDNGLAIGAAYYGWSAILRKDRITHSGSTRFGKTYPKSAIDSAVSIFADRLLVRYSEDVVEETASILTSGAVTGWFQGRSEFGPRALGGRSILADPRQATVRDFINSRVKFREDFRPFAPSVLLEDVNAYFECDYESPYMLLVASVRQEYRRLLTSVVHLDSTARIQTVAEDSEPIYCRLLKAFKRHTGIGVLLNTSLNKRGMPIVETPEQAIEFFLGTGLHVLVIGSYILKRRQEPPVEPTLSVVLDHMQSMLRRNWTVALSARSRCQFKIPALHSCTLNLGPELPFIEQTSTAAPDVVIECDEADFRLLVEHPAALPHLIRDSRLRITGDTRVFRQLIQLLLS